MAGAQVATARKVERVVFKYGNRFMMVPLLKAGLGRLLGSPPTGYIMLLRTVGRKSGQLRYNPLNYALDDGSVYCLSGFGEQANWLANLRSDPNVQVRLPGRVIDGIAEEVTDPVEARRLGVKVARSCGLALLFEAPRCLFMSDEELAGQLEGRPVVRITAVDGPIVPGPYDPGGRGWIPLMLAQITALVGVSALLGRRRSHRRSRH